jgi:beta-glucosidase-like glycosyl hydrolase
MLGGHGYYFQTHMNQTIERQLLQMRELDRATTRVWRTAFRLGMFDDHNGATTNADVSTTSWEALGWEDIDSERNQAAALQAALQSLTRESPQRFSSTTE